MVASIDPFIQTSEAQAVLPVVASCLALAQTILMLPRQAKNKSILWTLILLSVGPYLANIIAIRLAQSSTPPSFGHSREHPVEALVREAKDGFERLLQRQSQNYTAAEQEYRRRYGREPPPGFEGWYEFAAAHESPIIDEFDAIYESVSPFLKLSGKEVAQIMRDAQYAPKIDLWACAFSTSRAETTCIHPHRTFDRHIGLLFNKLLRELGGILPDVSFLVNQLDEPRVLTPPPSQEGGSQNGAGRFTLTDLAEQPTWDAITKFCVSGETNGSTVETFGLPFVTDRATAMDLCQHPEYRAMHGLFMNPTSFRLIEGLVPVFAAGAPSTMGDIPFPSPAYIESEFRYDQSQDMEWDQKRNNLYWAGSTTGGFAKDGRWRHYQRQRFVQSAQNLGGQQNYYLRETDRGIDRKGSRFLNGRLFDVAFTRIFQCLPKYCRDERSFFRVKAWTHKDRALGSRLVFDLDGNGVSGRYYKLLASRSVPLKQTLLREWHDDRLVPWVHYVPVSPSMEELPELVFYLTSTESGRQRAKEIAQQGREWFTNAFRDIDMTIYIYRLLLEMARLQDPKRPTG